MEDESIARGTLLTCLTNSKSELCPFRLGGTHPLQERLRWHKWSSGDLALQPSRDLVGQVAPRLRGQLPSPFEETPDRRELVGRDRAHVPRFGIDRIRDRGGGCCGRHHDDRFLSDDE